MQHGQRDSALQSNDDKGPMAEPFGRIRRNDVDPRFQHQSSRYTKFRSALLKTKPRKSPPSTPIMTFSRTTVKTLPDILLNQSVRNRSVLTLSKGCWKGGVSSLIVQIPGCYPNSNLTTSTIESSTFVTATDDIWISVLSTFASYVTAPGNLRPNQS